MLSLLLISSLFACSAQTPSNTVEDRREANTTHSESIEDSILSAVDQYYRDQDTTHLPSQSLGSISNGSLQHGRLIPFSGKNYHYFDTLSYLSERAYMHENVLETVLDAYSNLDSLLPSRHFCVMECSHKDGGNLFPHRTHQNGLSVDFMMPKLQNGLPYYGLDGLGGNHYALTFDKNGRYSEDASIELDFNTIALHILELQKSAKQNGLTIEKVIINTDLKDELFATVNGQILMKSGIYVVQNLTPLINSVHDDHFHVDFKKK